jgi:excisionase family DNA binding protein
VPTRGESLVPTTGESWPDATASSGVSQVAAVAILQPCVTFPRATLTSAYDHRRTRGVTMSDPTERLLTLEQSAELLGTGVRFTRRLIAERRIQFVKVGRHVRIPEEALRQYIDAATVQPTRAPR